MNLTRVFLLFLKIIVAKKYETVLTDLLGYRKKEMN